jgi:lysophospholipase L1-like esterase
VRTLDLRPAVRAAEERLYWVKDLHLNVDGHRRVAEALLPVVAELLDPERIALGEDR